MKGKITIECDDRGTHLDVSMHCTKQHDRTFLVHALGRALGLEAEDYIILVVVEGSGVLDDKGPTRISIDRDELLKQLKEEI